MRKLLMVLAISIFAVELTGCASFAKKWKSIIGSDSADSSAQKKNEDGQPAPPTSFNSQPTYGAYKERQYKRVTKQNFTEEQMLEENAGSLWKKEGQGSYLFAQNNLRVLGDIINVDVEGKVADNLNLRINLLKKAQIKNEIPAPKAVPRNIAKIPRPANSNEKAQASSPNPNQQNNDGVGEDGQVAKTENAKPETTKFDSVPCRIVEKNTDGSYRVKGLQIVYVGKKEYKLIVTGNVRPDDVSTDNISSTKIIDSKFDLVATNKDVSK